jgi:hypothetical protein
MKLNLRSAIKHPRAIVSLILLLLLFSGLKVEGQRSSHFTADATFDIEVHEYPQYLDFPGSPLTPMELVRVRYRSKDALLGETVSYEDLWYRKGDIVGCRRYRPLGLEPHGTVAIKLSIASADSRSCNQDEAAAAANACIRVMLDATLNHEKLIDTEIPPDSYFPVLAEFERNNFFDFQKVRWTVNSNIFFPIRSADDRHKQSLLYCDAGEMP